MVIPDWFWPWLWGLVSPFWFNIFFALVYHSGEIQKAWEECGSDRVCRGERAIRYICLIFGASRPAVMISRIIRNLVNRVWLILRGEILLEEEDFGANSTGALGMIVYALIEIGLTSIWDKFQYWTVCLKTEDCDLDDMLLWIYNMKLGYCEDPYEDDEEYFQEVEYDTNEAEMEDGMDLCNSFFNELPLIMMMLLVGLLHVISLSLDGYGGGAGAPAPIAALVAIPQAPPGDGRGDPGTPPNEPPPAPSPSPPPTPPDESSSSPDFPGDGPFPSSFSVFAPAPDVTFSSEQDDFLHTLSEAELRKLLHELAREHREELLQSLTPMCQECTYNHSDHHHDYGSGSKNERIGRIRGGGGEDSVSGPGGSLNEGTSSDDDVDVV